jgi:hypothetical protein
MKIILKYFLCICLFAATTKISFAQQKEVITKVQKFKPPVVKTYLGVNQNGAKVTADEGNQLIALPLKIVDAQNHNYLISSYRFLYRKKSVILNDETGKKEETFSITADRFNSTPLPKVWINNIQGRLQPEEQLYFFDIVVKDKQGRDFFAPELKITIK